jgi:hypothetical protein
MFDFETTVYEEFRFEVEEERRGLRSAHDSGTRIAVVISTCRTGTEFTASITGVSDS